MVQNFVQCPQTAMLASEGPSIYGRSPPAGFLPDCGPLWIAPRAPQPAPLTTRRSAPAFLIAPRLSPLCINFKPPSKSCLQHNGSAEKKKVVFADDQGLQLTEVRVMPEPSNVPPFWTVLPNTDLETPKLTAVEKWEMRFVQPASEYVSFRRRINDENVALENVIIKETEGYLTGTVKVKNLDFNKEVIIRSTADGWRTCEDTTCTYSNSTIVSNVSFDTFNFKVQLPTHSKRLEFCVSFRCLGAEHWDNNYGVNYIMERSITFTNINIKTEPYYGRVRTGNAAQNGWSGNSPYWYEKG